MTYEDFDNLWKSLDEDQKDSVRAKARWEHMTLWAVCNDWPGIWKGGDMKWQNTEKNQ